MRFPQLKIGQRFEYQSKTYTKTGPLTASEEGTGASSMIRRSAKVTLVDGSGSVECVKQSKQNYSREEVVTLCREFKLNLCKRLENIASQQGELQIEQVLSNIESIDIDCI